MNGIEQVPSWVFYSIGLLILTNLSSLGGLIYASWRLVWWLSKVDSGIKDAKLTAVRAHKRIDRIAGDHAGEEVGETNL